MHHQAHSLTRSLPNHKLVGLILLILLLFVTGCNRGLETASVTGEPAGRATHTPASPTITSSPTPSPTPTQTPSPTATATPTQTPSPTPTPTPTALPVAVSGNPRAASYHPPTPAGNAPCGTVDTLDFPLRPPDAIGARGGTDFGRYRDRYELYHAGEDWWITPGEGSFGEPVHSIGHGLITYADPNGWGRDQGVVIVRHTFADGHTFLSFYGHLDPPSVEVRAGTCIERGQLVGNIGRPRTPPHLHFEIRTHLPDEPGPGYSGTDPTTNGWLPPSQTIWNERVAAAAGVIGQEIIAEGTTRPVGLLLDGDLLVLADEALQRIDFEASRQPLPEALSDNIAEAVVDISGEVIYTANRLGGITAYQANTDPAEEPGEPLWTVDIDQVGTPHLLPLPAGGVAFFVRNELLTLSRQGDLLDQQAVSGRVFSWAVGDQFLVVTTSGREGQLLLVSPEGTIGITAGVGGKVAIVGDMIWIYADDGLYRATATNTSPTLVYRLPTAFLSFGDILPLPDGGVLLAHRDLFDRRLVALDADGGLRWERSLSTLEAGEMRLLAINGTVYMVNGLSGASNRTLAVYTVDLNQPDLRQVLDLPLRSPLGLTGWVVPLPSGTLLLGIDEHLIRFDPAEAQRVISAAR